jgi:hypothetical protein
MRSESLNFTSYTVDANSHTPSENCAHMVTKRVRALTALSQLTPQPHPALAPAGVTSCVVASSAWIFLMFLRADDMAIVAPGLRT